MVGCWCFEIFGTTNFLRVSFTIIRSLLYGKFRLRLACKLTNPTVEEDEAAVYYRRVRANVTNCWNWWTTSNYNQLWSRIILVRWRRLDLLRRALVSRSRLSLYGVSKCRDRKMSVHWESVHVNEALASMNRWIYRLWGFGDAKAHWEGHRWLCKPSRLSSALIGLCRLFTWRGIDIPRICARDLLGFWAPFKKLNATILAKMFTLQITLNPLLLDW